MEIYHFCAARDVRKILKNGLTKGGVLMPVHTGFLMFDGYCWLTLDGDPNRQSWNTHYLVHYSRAAYRLTIEIPNEEERWLLDRDALEQRIPGSGKLFDGWAGSEHWRVYWGRIPAKWIQNAVCSDALA